MEERDITSATDHDGITLIKEFTVERIKCRIHLYEGSHYTAYIQVPTKYRELSIYEFWHELRILSPGGFTYGIDSGGWAGFDFNHANDICMDEKAQPLNPNDYSIQMAREGDLYGWPNYWGPAEVKRETCNVAEQFAELDPFEYGI